MCIRDSNNIDNLISNQPYSDLKSAFEQVYRALSHISHTPAQYGEIQYVAEDAMMLIIGSRGLQYTGTRVSTEELAEGIKTLLDLKLLCNENGTITEPHHLLTKPR